MSQTLPETASVFAALGDQTRLGLVTRLSNAGPLSIARLAAGERVSRQAVTKHLHVLSEARLAHSHSWGRELIWELDTQRLDEARASIARISQQWDEALGKLKRLVDDESAASSK